MHTAYISAQTAEKRKQNVEDVRKRSEFRKAHGMDKDGAFGGWEAKTDREIMGPGMREGSPVATLQANGGGSPDEYVDFEGSQRPPVRKWFGIW